MRALSSGDILIALSARLCRNLLSMRESLLGQKGDAPTCIHPLIRFIERLGVSGRVMPRTRCGRRNAEVACAIELCGRFACHAAAI